ncbi:hypothetical protein Tco_0102872 [Tanacetum coccineum]
MELEDSDSRLCSMPDDDIVSLDSFKTPDSTDQESISDYQDTVDTTFNAFAEVPALSEPFGHLQGELHSLNTKVDKLESSISKSVPYEIKSSIPSCVADAIKEQLHGLLKEALKACLPQIHESIQQTIQQSLEAHLPKFTTYIDTTAQRPMNK